MLMYAPQISARASFLNDALRELLSEADFELAVLAAAREFHIDFVWNAHVGTARRAGGERCHDRDRPFTRRPVSLSAREKLIVTLGRELVGGHALSPSTFDAAKAGIRRTRD